MARRPTKNITGLARIPNINPHQAWIGYICVRCSKLNLLPAGDELLTPEQAYVEKEWRCRHCNYVHSRLSNLPFKSWRKSYCRSESTPCQRFWQGFFRMFTESRDAYWKQCNTCGRVLPASAFSRHVGWGPLEKQMECRSCKGTINAVLNPKRTREQLWESAIKRRVGDLLLEGENQKVGERFIKNLFQRFGYRCFKTRKKLKIQVRGSWAIDHILPSKWLYPLTKENAALLSREANNKKRDRWPSEFYTNSELIRLAKITGADLRLLASKHPVVNADIDVDACVSRYLQVREHSNLEKRIRELKKLLADYGLAGQLSKRNKRLLGYR